MLIVQVSIFVLEECIDSFIEATIENASESIKEEGVVRFDFLQDSEDTQHFQLTEIYKNSDAPLEHKRTAHYLKWREKVAPMMEKPRLSKKYVEVFPKEINAWISKNEK